MKDKIRSKETDREYLLETARNIERRIKIIPIGGEEFKELEREITGLSDSYRKFSKQYGQRDRELSDIITSVVISYAQRRD